MLTCIAERGEVQGSPATWWDCHRCHFGYVDQNVSSGACAELERTGPPDFQDCSVPSHRFIDHGLYAAQLAWWLRFFPPEQFLIISAWQLRDEFERIRVRAAYALRWVLQDYLLLPKWHQTRVVW